MRRKTWLGGVLSVLALTLLISPDGRARSQSGDAGDDGPKKPETATVDRAALEAEFAKTLENAVLVGKFRLISNDEIGDEKPERYEIRSAKKLAGDRWIITARVKYGTLDVEFPFPVDVVWAGDTPIISVTDVRFLTYGPYTARVMVYRGLYTGTWFGPGHGGLMSGRVERAAADAKDAKDAERAEPKSE